ncbi:MAG: hypothetical protein NAOJABEB_00527 [Steroidobacteraceae bacterium]|nr:hypothetical protein [Steroidobacteraceae bacterium]
MTRWSPRAARLSSIGMILVLASGAAWAQLDGALPIPVLRNVTVDAVVTWSDAAGTYQYSYTLNNPAANTGSIDGIQVDIRSSGPAYGDPDALIVEFGSRNLTFRRMLQMLPPDAATMVPVGLDAPTNWYAAIGARGFAAFIPGTPAQVGRLPDAFPPGQSRSGFVLTSFTTPIIREMTLVPDWIYVSTSPDGITGEEEKRAREIADQLPDHVFTLGPSAVFPGSYEQWDLLRDNLQRAIALGWISDAALAQTLASELAQARAALDARDGTLAKTRLAQLLNTIAASRPEQRRREVSDLVTLNAQNLITSTPDTPVPFEPKVTFAPDTASLQIGTRYSLTADAINLGDGSPLNDYPVDFEIIEGPNESRAASLRTGSNGKAVFSYVGTVVGRDRIAVSVPGDFHVEAGVAEVEWTAGPDLAIPFFAPPVLRSQGGNDAVIHDMTVNISDIAASPPSITRYFLGDTSPVDLSTAAVLGERAIPALEPHAEDMSPAVHVRLPDGLAAGTYYLAACADAPQSVVELNELNNCSFGEVEGYLSVVAPFEPGTITNAPPVCTNAAADPPLLWPPNHKLKVIEIAGVTDPDGDHVTLRISAITQDEPVNGLGDGDTAPDGFGVGTSQAQIRSERSGTANGRVYRIAFTGDDGKGETCTGAVSVGVPHDRSQQAQPIDDGQSYDSTQQ